MSLCKVKRLALQSRFVALRWSKKTGKTRQAARDIRTNAPTPLTPQPRGPFICSLALEAHVWNEMGLGRSPRGRAAVLAHMCLIDALIGSPPGSHQHLGQAVPRVVGWGDRSGAASHLLCMRSSLIGKGDGIPRTLQREADVCLRLYGGAGDSGAPPPHEAADELLKGWYEQRMRILEDGKNGAGVDGKPNCSPGAAPQDFAASGSESALARDETEVGGPGDAGAEADALVEYADALSRASWNNTAAAHKVLDRALALQPTLASALALSARLQLQSAAGAAAEEEQVLATLPSASQLPHDAEESAALLTHRTAPTTGLEALLLDAETRMRAGDAAGAAQLAGNAWDSAERRGAHAEVKRLREELKEVGSERDNLQRSRSFLRYRPAAPRRPAAPCSSLSV